MVSMVLGRGEIKSQTEFGRGWSVKCAGGYLLVHYIEKGSVAMIIKALFFYYKMYLLDM